MPPRRQDSGNARKPRVVLDAGRLSSVLAERRGQLGWSIRELSERSGVSSSAVHSLEQGNTRVQLDNFVSILAALDLRPDQVLIVEGVATPLEKTALEAEIELIKTIKDPREALLRLAALLSPGE